MLRSYTSFIYSQIQALFCDKHFASQQDHAGNTPILNLDTHLPKFNRINSLVRSSIIGVATCVIRGEGGSVALQMEEMDEL